ncbi:LOW QUALITY PROTEIN: hypothetical protein OSB04_024132, partial [Centaurea solstitialis]
MFHESQMRKCLDDDTTYVPIDDIQVDERMNYDERPITILEQKQDRYEIRFSGDIERGQNGHGNRRRGGSNYLEFVRNGEKGESSLAIFGAIGREENINWCYQSASDRLLVLVASEIMFGVSFSAKKGVDVQDFNLRVLAGRDPRNFEVSISDLSKKPRDHSSYCRQNLYDTRQSPKEPESQVNRTRTFVKLARGSDYFNLCEDQLSAK